MVNRANREQMRDYIFSKLEPSHEKVDSTTFEFVPGIKSNCILVDEEGIVLLIDRVYPDKTLNRVYSVAQSERSNIAPVLFKDGKTFFRNAVEKNYFKKDKFLSLKNYSDKELNQMILFRPEEIFLNSKREWVQYFQPRSERLEEGIESFKFRPVIFDYSHIDSYERFKPRDRTSERLHIWDQRIHTTGDLRLGERYLKLIKQ